VEVSTYYKNPQPDVVLAQLELDRQMSPKRGGNLPAGYVGFMAGLMVSSRPLEERLLRWGAGLPPLTQKMVFEAVRLRDGLLEVNITKAETLDMFWGYYFATGARQAIRRLISALDHSNIAASDFRMQCAVRDAAIWSLRSNCKLDIEVLLICRQFLEGGLPPLKTPEIQAVRNRFLEGGLPPVEKRLLAEILLKV
jgi:hypothetical protein